MLQISSLPDIVEEKTIFPLGAKVTLVASVRTRFPDGDSNGYRFKRNSDLTSVESRTRASRSKLTPEYDSESLVSASTSLLAVETRQMRKSLFGILDAVTSKSVRSGSHTKLLILKNFSRVSSRSIPVL